MSLRTSRSRPSGTWKIMPTSWFAEICTRVARRIRVLWYFANAAGKSPSVSSAETPRQTASSIAIAAPCAMYWSMKCAASPSSATLPRTQLSTGWR
jgi:hypothetical protein